MTLDIPKQNNSVRSVVIAPSKGGYHATAGFEELRCEKEIAKLLKVSVSWLQKARVRGDGPPFIRISGGCIRYQISAVQEWVQSRIVHSTSQYADKKKGGQ